MRLPSWPTVVQSCGLAYQSLQGADMTCIGYVCADKEVARPATALLEHGMPCARSVSQGAAPALYHPPELPGIIEL